MKRKKRNKFDAKWIVIGILGLMVVGGVVYGVSDISERPITIQNVEHLVIETAKNVGEMVGLSFGASTDYCAGDEDTANLCVIDIYDLTVAAGGLTVTGDATFSNDVTMGNSTTTIDRLDSIEIVLDLDVATSTGGSSDPHTVTVVGSLENTGNDLICDTQGTLIDIHTANGHFAYGLRMGTSTSATSTESHLIDEDATDNEIGTTTTDILTKTDDEGSESEESWVWNNSEFVVITRTFQTQNAASSSAITRSVGEGVAHLECRSRY